MRVLSKIQSSLSELTFMHAGLITARSIPLRRGSFFMNAARTNHKEAALSLCAPSNVCNSLSHSHYMRESLICALNNITGQGVWRAQLKTKPEL
jgi:hypothetical protein